MKSSAPPANWFIKFIECLFVVIAVCDFFDSLVAMWVVSIYPSMHSLFFGIISFSLKGMGLVFAIGYPLYWRRQEVRGARESASPDADSVNAASPDAGLLASGLRHAWFRGILRYWLAVEICNYGFAKILETQFAHSYFKADSLVGSLSGYDLTWNYFGYSYALAVIIGLIQVGGSALLLFRRTTLLGAAILLPVMVNIALVDIFYGILQGAVVNAILFTLGLSYLLLLRWQDLKAVFLVSKGALLPAVKMGGFKYVLRVLMLAYGFLFIWHFASLKNPLYIRGKWKVETMIRNGDTVKAQAWLEDSTAWKNIYVEETGRVYFSPNPYVYEAGRSQVGHYGYDKVTHVIRWVVLPRQDTIKVQVRTLDGQHAEWKMVQGKDTTELGVVKVE